MSKVYLTGAGPGDIELMTIKSARVVREADIVIYDKLVNPKILEMIKEGAVLKYVGKENGKHSSSQEEINKIIYQASKKYKNVVRLKGGDPFVFGRGGEEAIYLHKRGVKFEIIPGVTSAVSVPAYAGIPVTHRGITTSFRVVTGHETVNKKISQLEWQTFLNDETIVFLMGFHNIKMIVQKLLEVGKRKNYPCAVISKGSTPEQKVIAGKLENIIELSKGAQTPAIIVVGEVVNLRKKMKWFN